ncbi:MAG: hypothetical protein ACT4P7_22920 [Gemmatimonadaceae bacterium]
MCRCSSPIRRRGTCASRLAALAALLPAGVVGSCAPGDAPTAIPPTTAVAAEFRAAVTYTLVDISVPSEHVGFGLGINDLGATAITSFGPLGGPRASLRLPDGARIPLGTIPGVVSGTYAMDINNRNYVVGFAYAGGRAKAFRWTPADAGKTNEPGRILPTMARGQSIAYAVNNLGQVGGERSLPNGGVQGFLWRPETSTVSDVGTLGGTYASVRDVNDFGVAVGQSSTAGSQSHAFLWTDGAGMIDLGTLGGTFSMALGINNRSEVVGWAETASGPNHAFLWTRATGMIDLGTLGGPHSHALDINDAGVIVGNSDAPGTVRAWVRHPGGPLIDLGDLGGGLSRAQSINRCGKISGSTTLATVGGDRAAIWDKRC